MDKPPQKKLKALSQKLPHDRGIDRIIVDRFPCSNLLPRSDQAALNVRVPGRVGQFVDVAGIQVQMTTRVLARDQAQGVLVPLTNQRVLPLCLFLHTFFESMSLDINGKPFLRTYEFNAFLKYIRAVLYARKTDKAGILKSALYYRDASDHFDEVPANGNAAPGANTRKVKVEGSAPMYLQGKLDLEPFLSGKPLPEGVDLDISLVPAHPRKCLVAAIVPPAAAIPDFAIEIVRFVLLVPYIVPKASLLKQIVSYNYTKNEVIKFLQPANTRLFTPRCLHRGEGMGGVVVCCIIVRG
jgi:hypothetical protein